MVNGNDSGVHLCACVLTLVISDSATLWTVAHQVPLAMWLSRKEYLNGLPLLPPRDLPDPGIESESPASPVLQADSSLLSHWGSPGLCLPLFKSWFHSY